MKKIISVVGARPQFIKAFSVSKAIKRQFREVLVHTGQHYDREMSDIFFNELGINKPHYNLGVKEESHAQQTGKMLIKLERVFVEEKPHLVLIYGDTNTTLAAALGAAKLGIPVAHIEAGLRSYNRTMPEEINRIIADQLSEYLFAPTEAAVRNLKKEGIEKGVFLVGDVMYDTSLYFGQRADEDSRVDELLGVGPKDYLLCTIHRSGNTDNRESLKNIIDALTTTENKVVFPVHPRTKKNMEKWKMMNRLKNSENIIITKPLGYLDFLWLEKNAKKILTDSGGVQKEAYFYRVPCITLREDTEWIETVEDGWNILSGTDKEKIADAVSNFTVDTGKKRKEFYGKGNAAELIAGILKEKV